MLKALFSIDSFQDNAKAKFYTQRMLTTKNLVIGCADRPAAAAGSRFSVSFLLAFSTMIAKLLMRLARVASVGKEDAVKVPNILIC
jgi:hypothetical protein